jgi:acyl-CoA dehydrogenase
MFNQTPPHLANQFTDDRVLQSYLKRKLPPEMYHEVAPSLTEMGRLAAEELYAMQLADRLNEPALTQWDAWGNRIDQIEVSPLWKVAERLAAEFGVVGTAYDSTYGAVARPYQFALAYLFHPSTDVYTCPLAMTDGAARTLLVSGNQELIERAVPRLTSRDPQRFWTSGQWMTEAIGGSDVGQAETVARQDEDGTWRLYGRKWFTSATTSQMALVLARPEGNPTGGAGLALFYVETREDLTPRPPLHYGEGGNGNPPPNPLLGGGVGRLRNITVNRLKDKLGTRKVPTAELMLEGTPAIPVAGLTHGTRAIVPMLHLTRTWNSVMAVSFMRRGIALAREYARRRVAFGSPLAQKPLHVDTLATMQAEMEAAFHLSFYLVELIGQEEQGQLDESGHALLRLLTSIVKLTTGRQVVEVMSEAIEAFGGAGYVEDTGIPALLRDAHVLPIWEGTTNVLSLDTLRVVGKGNGLAPLEARMEQAVATLKDLDLKEAGFVASTGFTSATRWLESAVQSGQEAVELGARRFALTLGRSLALALLAEHAQGSLNHEQDVRPRTAALRLAALGVNMIREMEVGESFLLGMDEI